MGHKRLTFVIGPEEHGPLFKSKDDVMSQDEVYHFMKPVFGEGVVYDAPLNKRQEQMQTLAKVGDKFLNLLPCTDPFV